MSFEKVNEFEAQLASFFGAKYAVAFDSCTHGLECVLRMKKVKEINAPVRTYISIPMLAKKLDIICNWVHEEWQDYYELAPSIYDAAVLWKKNGFIPGSYMGLSFQFQKHLSLGRGGAILLDDFNDYELLKRMSYDGRIPSVPWRDQVINVEGYHYYMSPETAELGLNKLGEAKRREPRVWVYSDWPNISNFPIFLNDKRFIDTKIK